MKTNLTHSVLRRNHRTLPVLALHLLLAATTLAATLVPAHDAFAAKRADKREIDARQAFAAGRYQEALNLYAELYADKVHPTYLRNIGRCYQNLKQPDKAINAFRDYLRQAKGVNDAERAEVEGYIAEMEKLQAQQEEAARPPQPVVQPQPQPTGPTVPTPQPQPADNTLVTQPLPPPPPPEPKPFYKKAWFWGVVGAVVVVGVAGGLYAGGVFDSKSSVPCTAAGGCF